MNKQVKLEQAEMASANLLRVQNVGKVFGGNVTAVRDMSLDVRDGDFISLLGPSGCGKSKGQIAWRDGTTSDQLGVVFQEPTLMPWATVEDNIWLPLRLKGIKKIQSADDIQHILSLVGLSGFEKSYPRELSGGMKMRVSIARAMVTRPKLILMDEPFAALDEITRFKLNNDLLAMQAEIGCTGRGG